MADEREGQFHDTKRVANEDRIQTAGRKENDAQPLNAAADKGGAERYPSVRQDDAVERTGRSEQAAEGESRSFEPKPRQDGFEGPQGDPSEGKR